MIDGMPAVGHRNGDKTTVMLLVLMVVCMGILGRAMSQPIATPAPSQATFSIIQISDTQFLSESDPTAYDNLCQWIANQSSAFNLQMVIHTGDIVNDGSSATEWQNANIAMSILSNNSVPYCWDAGNHDQPPNVMDQGNPNGPWMGSQYSAFDASELENKPYWVGDLFEGKNTAVKFAIDNCQFLIVNIEYDANISVLNWMVNIFNAYPNANIIVATHFFLGASANYANPVNASDPFPEELSSILNNYPHVFLTLNGHDDTEPCVANMTDVNGREEVVFDDQSNGVDGAAAARIYTFNLGSKICNVTTYQVYCSNWLIDPYNQFSFTTDLQEETISASTTTVTPVLSPSQTTLNVPTGTSTLIPTPSAIVQSTPVSSLTQSEAPTSTATSIITSAQPILLHETNPNLLAAYYAVAVAAFAIIMVAVVACGVRSRRRQS